MTCLLCQDHIKNNVSVIDLLLLREADEGICQTCQEMFVPISDEHCSNCFKSGTDKVCKDCRYWENLGKSVNHQALYQYNEAMRAYFSQYKFLGDYLLRYAFAKVIKQAMKAYRDYLIVPIPTSNSRRELRGFDQVEGILDAAHIPYQALLTKKDGQKQSEKSRKERLHLEDNPFEFKGELLLPDKVLLVDDIYTTGATFQLAKALFHERGVKVIKTFSLCR